MPRLCCRARQERLKEVLRGHACMFCGSQRDCSSPPARLSPPPRLFPPPARACALGAAAAVWSKRARVVRQKVSVDVLKKIKKRTPALRMSRGKIKSVHGSFLELPHTCFDRPTSRFLSAPQAMKMISENVTVIRHACNAQTGGGMHAWSSFKLLWAFSRLRPPAAPRSPGGSGPPVVARDHGGSIS